MRTIALLLWVLLLWITAGCIEERQYQYATKTGEKTDVTADGMGDLPLPEEVTETDDLGPDLQEEDICQAVCKDKECGPNGCGGSCGGCGTNEVCSAQGKCKCPSGVGCMGICCPEDDVCGANGKCCTPDCGEDFCGLDGCGTKQCGDNGCGISCGKCGAHAFCDEEAWNCQCEFLVCGSSCCGDGSICLNDTMCCKPDCTGLVCGDDGCGGSCGTCDDDGNPCTDEVCSDGACMFQFNDDECDIGDPCTVNGMCLDGACIVQSKCDDKNECTDDSCDAGTCTNDPQSQNGMNCEDGNPCTDNSICADGLCLGDLVLPDEGVVTDCLCHEDGSCEPLEDGDLCNGTLYCHKVDVEDIFGYCNIDPATILGAAGACDDDDPCTLDSCDPIEGCVIQAKCEDGVDCTVDECSLMDGSCSNTADVTLCDDSIACTTDTCNPIDGCNHQPLDDECNDGYDCTTDTCNPDLGCEYVADGLACDDDADCTTDACDPDAGCTFTVDNAQCSDLVDCTIDTCVAYTGCLSQPDDMQCNDEVDCTLDVCALQTGCSNTPDSSSCDDLDPCTTDSCELLTGCANTPMSDDDPCGELPNWTCLNGACQCEPNCDGKMCGDNGCGAACGACGADEECDGGTCSCALFETTPGGSTEDEGASGIAVGIDGSFLVAGSQHVGGLTVARVTRISATGDDLGSQVFGLSGDRELRAIVPSPGGGFALAGYLTLDEVDGGRQAWLVLVTEELSVITEKTFGGELADEAQSVTALADGGYLLTGFTTTVDQGTDLWLARVDGAGETVFEAVFGGPKDDEGYHAIEISGDRLAVVGYTKSFSNGAEDAWLLLTDSAGIELDNITVGGAGEERARYVLETSGGEVFATGVSFGAALGAPEIWILRLNADGNVAWVKSYGGETLDSGAVIVETADNGLVIAGQSSLADGTNSEFRLVKILPDGETVVWDRSWGLEGDDSIRGLAVLPDGGFATCGIRGETTVSPGGDDVWVARLNQWGERACGCGDGACDGDEVCESCAVDCCP